MNNDQKQQYRVSLCGDWNLESADQTLKCPVKIPGSVLSAVTEQGILDDPYDRMNEYQTRELSGSRIFCFPERSGSKSRMV